ncbi:efflux RND transporter periplasmic adaptor subunit [Sansalvadorimonas sp. 2012CJ34-2]|uniref:Efflux RND transporter periplasmic adaptor subunit n=1 Tax=Parendozoicomonas callyspongiae TaxID=2942213 RepID=A0ABT0PF15_9GAMM|nr:efflux RND transporter periplasmic adaptor subunit [Sansalvadorimonas sp. 2012CJ34-2]MCL6269856.1 efflux RND transporter periplasmic adaptor subunit [Sansalvadorimonas sp. 2012CJ34-2]
MKKRMLFMLIFVIVLFGGLFAYKQVEQTMMAKGMASFAPPPVIVDTTEASQENWLPFLTSVGTLSARQGIDIKTESPGLVSKVLFESGQDIKQDTLLVQLDDDIEQANLKSYKAAEKLARLTWDRNRTLLEKKSISQTSFDQSSASLDEAKAAVEQTKATLRKKKINAPFSGRIGIRRVEPGDYVKEGVLVATLQNINQLFVDFNLPEQDYPELFNGQDVRFSVRAFPEQEFMGEVEAINARIDSNTRNIEVRALVENDALQLIPGMFADIRVLAKEPRQVITVPRTAVTYTLYGDSVYVVEGDSPEKLSVRLTQVKTGDIENDRVEIVSGLKAGTQVVTSGQLKLHNGAHVALSQNGE